MLWAGMPLRASAMTHFAGRSLPCSTIQTQSTPAGPGRFRARCLLLRELCAPLARAHLGTLATTLHCARVEAGW